jgi:futalosine hydrolase
MRRLVLVPTALELRGLELPEVLGPVELCGFGPVAAAARAATLLAERRPERVVLVGIAGTYDSRAAAIGTAIEVDRVAIDGFEGAGFEPWPGVGATIELRASSPARTLVTVLAPSSSPAEAADRRRRHPGAIAEDMEGYGVALACAIARVPLAIVRGISNEAGDRDTRGWRIREALAAAREIAGA